MGAGAAVFIWAAIILEVTFPLWVVAAFVAVARPGVDRRWLFWLTGVGLVIGLRTVTGGVAGLVILRLPAAREQTLLVLAAEMAVTAALAVPVLAALARGFARRGAAGPPRPRGPLGSP